MSAERYRLVGLARPRAGWFRDVSHWATSAALPIEFVKCVAVDELTARLRSGRVFSALVVDGGVAGIDRDLVDAARAAGAAVVVVDDGHVRRDWVALGVDAVLPEAFDRAQLLAALVERARPVAGPDTAAGDIPAPVVAGWPGQLVAVTGPAGGGTSIVAMALAQGMAASPAAHGSVLLADLALHADQALLHDAGEVVPGLQELVEAHRGGTPSPDDARSLCFEVAGRSYDLLLGLRRHRDWTVLRPRSVQATIDSLLRCYELVIADFDPDVEGDDEVGSIDVEERNLLARSVARRADLTVVVAPPSLSGLRRLVVTLDDLRRLGVDPVRMLPVVTRAPRRGVARAEITRAVGELTRGLGPGLAELASPVFVTERRGLDEVVRAGGPLPRPVVHPVTAAVEALLERQPLIADRVDAFEPVAVVPGSLGSWTEQEPAG